MICYENRPLPLRFRGRFTLASAGRGGRALQCGSGGITPMQQERPFCATGCSGMENLSQYREFTEQCELFAAEAKTERHRNILKDMAEAWRRLVQELMDGMN